MRTYQALLFHQSLAEAERWFGLLVDLAGTPTPHTDEAAEYMALRRNILARFAVDRAAWVSDDQVVTL